MRLAQADRTRTPRVVVAPVIPAEAAAKTPLRIRLAPSTAIPRTSFLRLRGLPPEVSVAGGHAIAAGAWAVPLNSLPGLWLNVPAGAAGRSEITITLVGGDGRVLAEARTTLAIAPEAAQSGAPAVSEAPSSGESTGLPDSMTPKAREVGRRFFERGEKQLEEGNVALAREFFQRAARAGFARGALLLGATYDPGELARMRVPGVQPNVAKARSWYERARELGGTEAAARLRRLAGK